MRLKRVERVLARTGLSALCGVLPLWFSSVVCAERIIQINGEVHPRLQAALSKAIETRLGMKLQAILPSRGQSFPAIVEEAMNKGYDLAFGSYLVWYLEQGALVPLDAYIQRDRLRLEPMGNLVSAMRVNTTIYHLPLLVSPMITIFNAELFRMSGLQYPSKGWQWGDFRLASRKIRVQGAYNGVYGAVFNNAIWGTMLMETGKHPLDADESTLEYTLDILIDILVEDRSAFYDVPRDYRNWRPSTLFIDGKAGMQIATLSYALPFASQTRVQWGIGPIPALPSGDNASASFVYSIGILAASKRQREAWEVVRFLASQQGAQVLASAGWAMPAYRTKQVLDEWARAVTGKDDFVGLDTLLDLRLVFEGRQYGTTGVEFVYGTLPNQLRRLVDGEISREELLHIVRVERDRRRSQVSR